MPAGQKLRSLGLAQWGGKQSKLNACHANNQAHLPGTGFEFGGVCPSPGLLSTKGQRFPRRTSTPGEALSWGARGGEKVDAGTVASHTHTDRHALPRVHTPPWARGCAHVRTHTRERVELLSPEESAIKGSWFDRCGGQGLGRESLCSWAWNTGHLTGPLGVDEVVRDTVLLIQRHTVSIR